MIDLRSDAVTEPTDEMWDAMRSVRLHGDFMDEDPTVLELEKLSARLMGKPDALFVMSGTMGNLIAAQVMAGDGIEALVDEDSHMAHFESAGIARLAGVSCVRIPAMNGEMNFDALQAATRRENACDGLATAMICIETSHNHSGGHVPSIGYMRHVANHAVDTGVAVHLDGARIFNAACALGIEAHEIAQYSDSVIFCLTKGLSAPTGAVLAGTREFIAKGRALRRMGVGGMRHTCIMAAAGTVALKSSLALLDEDHRRARDLWAGLSKIDERLVDRVPPMTNIVRLHITAVSENSQDEWLSALKDAGILGRKWGRDMVRLITHRHIRDIDVEKVQFEIGLLLKGKRLNHKRRSQA